MTVLNENAHLLYVWLQVFLSLIINMFMIYFFSNKITRDGIKCLADLLKTNTALEILDLTSNRMDDEGAIHLAETIHTYNSSLKG